MRIMPGLLTGVYNADATTYFAYAGALSNARKELINTLIAGIKSDLSLTNLRDKFDGFWLIANETSAAGYKNIAKNDHHCTVAGAGTFTADQGFAGNGSTGLLRSDFVPSTDGVAMTLNSQHLGIYVRTNRTTSDQDGNMVAATFGTSQSAIFCSFQNNTYMRLSDTSGAVAAATSSRGFWLVNRSASNAKQFYKNGSSLASDTTTASGSLSAAELVIGGDEESSPNMTTDQHALACVGGSLTSGQVASLTTRVETYMDAIGAGVI